MVRCGFCNKEAESEYCEECYFLKNIILSISTKELRADALEKLIKRVVEAKR